MDVALNIAILEECKTPTSHNASQGQKAREHNSKTSRKPQWLKQPYRPNEHVQQSWSGTVACSYWRRRHLPDRSKSWKEPAPVTQKHMIVRGKCSRSIHGYNMICLIKKGLITSTLSSTMSLLLTKICTQWMNTLDLLSKQTAVNEIGNWHKR